MPPWYNRSVRPLPYTLAPIRRGPSAVRDIFVSLPPLTVQQAAIVDTEAHPRSLRNLTSAALR